MENDKNRSVPPIIFLEIKVKEVETLRRMNISPTYRKIFLEMKVKEKETLRRMKTRSVPPTIRLKMKVKEVETLRRMKVHSSNKWKMIKTAASHQQFVLR